MFYIGTHLSSSRGMKKLGQEALKIGANTGQFFLRNPRGFGAKPLDEGDFRALAELMKTNSFGPMLAHAPYTFNPCSPDPQVRARARQMAAEDLCKMAHLPGSYYNIHPGTHGGQGAAAAVRQIADILNDLLSEAPGSTVLLETMSGRGTELGSRFEELAAVIERVDRRENLGICLDTCHLYAAGYDLVRDLDKVLIDFDRVIGLDLIKAVHLNDSRHPLGSRRDRHTTIGDGFIGRRAIAELINHPALKAAVFITETPLGPDGHALEIKALRKERRPGPAPRREAADVE